MALFDFLRRLGSGRDRSRQRGVRGQRAMDRRPDQGTVQISTTPASYPPPPPSQPPPPPGQPLPPPGQPAARPVSVPPPPRIPGPAPTEVRPRVEPLAPQPAAPQAPRRPQDTGGATEYVDVRKLVPHQVVGVLVAIEGDLEGEIYRVVDGENRIGRSPDCEIELRSKKISREHAKLIHRDGIFAIAPLSDKNPTLVNDEPTQGSELGDGDTIRLGRTTLRFRSIV